MPLELNPATLPIVRLPPLVRALSRYAAYHRDRRNLATHFIGIPVIVFAIILFLSRPALEVGVVALTPAVPVLALAVVAYLRLDLRYGLTMAGLMALGIWGAARLAAESTQVWLLTASALFVGGWVLQLVGHVFEGRKPAFLDDLSGFLIGPLFIVAEASFALGLRSPLRAAIEDQVGPTRSGSVRADSAS